jgi:RecA-family ATPase/5S rRNA maturation endonuclease (ribonuclease M5)
VYIVEGEKDVRAVEAAGGVATTNPMGAGKPLADYAEHFRGARHVVVVADNDEPGTKHAKAWREALLGLVWKVEMAEPAIGKDAHDALHGTGLKLTDAFKLVPWQADVANDRFSDEATSIAFIFDAAPPKRDYLVEDLLPAEESGLLVAAGGTGKGHLQIQLALSLAMGAGFGGHETRKARGIVLVSVEDDRDEIHRRMRDALDLWFRDKPPGSEKMQRTFLERHIRIVDLRGTTIHRLGGDLRENLLPVVDRLDDPGLILMDPLSRLLPELNETGGMNTQEGAGVILNELDALRTETGCSVIAAHHITKEAIKTDGQLKLTAATGSQQLVDLSRWVMNLAPVKPSEVSSSRLPFGHYLEAAVTKSNYTPPQEGRLIFERCEGGALRSVSGA